tara:strand:- start:827 stop:1861 length:1035 start_codon:yes stop_codon:yes gene_type:complete
MSSVLVVGGGIFGSTAAIVLSREGFDVTLHEELDDIMKCASNINQYRLHSGYHYPRSKETAQECLDGLQSFKEEYEDSIISWPVNHFYTISSENSLVSPDEYIKFLDDMELPYEHCFPPEIGSDLTIKVEEELFDNTKIKSDIKQKMLSSNVHVFYNRKTTKKDFDDYDYIVISTYVKLNELLDEPREFQFEVVEKPVVKLPDSFRHKSIVVMDGPFMCLDPYGRTEYHVLGNVVHAIHQTSIGLKPKVDDKLKEYLNSGVIKNPTITNIDKFVESGKVFFEDFDKLEHIGSMYTIRTVLSNRDYDDARPTIVTHEGKNIYSIFSGKIGTCVKSAKELVGELDK